MGIACGPLLRGAAVAAATGLMMTGAAAAAAIEPAAADASGPARAATALDASGPAAAARTGSAPRLAAAGGSQVTPIPEDPFASSVTPFLGAPAAAAPVSAGPAVWQNPFMAPNGSSELHNDAYQSDNNTATGPLGQRPAVTSAGYDQECASTTFDSQGRLLSVCVGAVRPTLRLLDPHTLATLASFDLPPRSASSLSSPFTSFGGGGYFYLDHHDQAVIPANDGHIDVIGEAGTAAQPELTLLRSYDVTSYAASSPILSALPDSSGRLWFVTGSGVVGTVDTASGAVRAAQLPSGETIGNSFAVDETGGVFIVSDHALYRFDAGPDGQPVSTWRQPYDSGTRQKPGQSEYGSGTTPTIVRSGGHNYVAITDNADPRMHVLVYRADKSGPGPSPVCEIPVFQSGQSDTDNSLIAFGDSLIVENNYGYTGPEQPGTDPLRPTPTTTPGLTRIDVSYATGGCHQAWANNTVRIPSSVSKSSTAAGLVYVYSHPAANEVQYSGPHPQAEDPWYLTAIDIRTGRQVWSRLTGVGFGYDNNYAPITVGPDGSAYVGVLGGLLAVHDGPG